MFRQDELDLIYSLKDDYKVLICNAHDIRLQSKATGHEWIVISPYDGSACEILHRHSVRYPFHHQRGQYDSIMSAIEYIKRHDQWYSKERTES